MYHDETGCVGENFMEMCPNRIRLDFFKILHAEDHLIFRCVRMEAQIPNKSGNHIKSKRGSPVDCNPFPMLLHN